MTAMEIIPLDFFLVILFAMTVVLNHRQSDDRKVKLIILQKIIFLFLLPVSMPFEVHQ